MFKTWKKARDEADERGRSAMLVFRMTTRLVLVGLGPQTANNLYSPAIWHPISKLWCGTDDAIYFFRLEDFMGEDGANPEGMFISG